VSVTEQIIDDHGNIDLPTNDGCTVFYITAAKGYASVTKQLLETHCNSDLHNRTTRSVRSVVDKEPVR
jgi:hypothetical protein